MGQTTKEATAGLNSTRAQADAGLASLQARSLGSIAGAKSAGQAQVASSGAQAEAQLKNTEQQVLAEAQGDLRGFHRTIAPHEIDRSQVGRLAAEPVSKNRQLFSPGAG